MTTFTLKKAQWAKDLTIKLWTYLAQHPKITRKLDVPDPLLKKIIGLNSRCPLCHIFLPQGAPASAVGCVGCPLANAGERCDKEDAPFHLWLVTSIKEQKKRKIAAQQLVDTVSAWIPVARKEVDIG
jgi:hypothetical protein